MSEQLDFPDQPERPVRPSFALPPPPAQRTPPMPLYEVDRPRNRMVPCRHCPQANHETRLWCTSCGHQMGVPLSECVCESCRREL